MALAEDYTRAPAPFVATARRSSESPAGRWAVKRRRQTRAPKRRRRAQRGADPTASRSCPPARSGRRRAGWRCRSGQSWRWRARADVHTILAPQRRARRRQLCGARQGGPGGAERVEDAHGEDAAASLRIPLSPKKRACASGWLAVISSLQVVHGQLPQNRHAARRVGVAACRALSNACRCAAASPREPAPLPAPLLAPPTDSASAAVRTALRAALCPAVPRRRAPRRAARAAPPGLPQ